MANKKTGARKSAAKNEGPAQPSAADRKAQAEAQRPIEPIGPGVEHEDHEGGITDSLAQKGVRAPLPTAEEKEKAAKEAQKTVRAPSVRDRQTGLTALVARGGSPQVRDTVDEKGKPVIAPRGAQATLAARKGARIVPVVATRLGFYPADGRLRAPGEAFDYVMGPDEEKLPSWMEDASGKVDTREIGETSPTFDVAPVTSVDIARDGTVTSRPARAAI